MGLLSCPFCEQKVDSEARKCFFCGAELKHDSEHLDHGLFLERQHFGYARKVVHPVSLKKIMLIVFLGAALVSLIFFLVRHFH
jgi:hypothetical protein